MIAPAGRLSFMSLLHTDTSRMTAATMAIILSTTNFASKTTGVIRAVVPDMLAPDDEMAQKAEAVLDDLTAVWEYICNA